MINIKNEYIDNNGKLYNIRNINLDEKKDLRDNIGTFVTETKREANYFFDSEDALTDGVYIYKSNMDPNKALRIYKDCSNYPYVYHNDIVLISKLPTFIKVPSFKISSQGSSFKILCCKIDILTFGF